MSLLPPVTPYTPLVEILYKGVSDQDPRVLQERVHSSVEECVL